MFLLQSHLRERVSGESIKPGRDQKHVRVEVNQKVKRLVNRRYMLLRVAVRGDRPIENVASRHCTRTWIAGVLVNRRKPDSLVTKNDLFGAVAVVGVEVPDPDAFAAGCERVMGSDRDRVQIAKTHRLGRGCVMARRTHQGKSFFTAEGNVDRADRRSGSASSVLFNTRIVGRIRIKIEWLPQPLQMFRSMRPENFLFGSDPRLHPDPVWAL